MVLRPLHHAPRGHLEDLAYLVAHLKADPQAADLAPNAEAASEALKARSEDWNTKHHGVVEAQAGLENAAEVLHEVVRTARDVILKGLKHNRSAPKFVTYFPRGLAAVTRAPYLDQLIAVRSVAERCAQEPNPEVREQASVLRAAADAMDAAFARRSKARAAESASYGQLQVQKLQAIDTCRRAGHRLTELYPEERDRVRSFFRQPRRKQRATEPRAAEPARTAGTPVSVAPDAGTTLGLELPPGPTLDPGPRTGTTGNRAPRAATILSLEPVAPRQN